MSQAQAPIAPTPLVAPTRATPRRAALLVRAARRWPRRCWPSTLLHILVGLTDTYLANHLEPNKAEATAAVGTVGYIFWFIGLFAGAIGTGSTAIIAREVGARHRRRANSVCGQSMLFAAMLGVALAIFLWLCGRTGHHVHGLQGTPRDFALDYLRLLAPVRARSSC